MIKSLLVGMMLLVMCSYLVTDTLTFGYPVPWNKIRQLWPQKHVYLTEAQLAKHDGTDPKLPIYMAIDGQVFDVTEGRKFYGPGGSYSFFAGKDAARAYATGCFETHLTHDLRGLSPEQLAKINGWASFYRNHHTYTRVGTVIHPPIPEDAPIPPSCKDGSAQKP